MAKDRPTVVFPEFDEFEDPHTGNTVHGERLIEDELLGVEVSTGSLGEFDQYVEEGETVFRTKGRGDIPTSEMGRSRDEVTEDDVFVRPPKQKSIQIDPREVHESRSEYAQSQDEARDARLTTDVEKWTSDVNSWDFPGVDTGPTFREKQGDNFDTDSFLNFL